MPAEHEVALEAVLGERLKFLLVNAPEIGIEAARVLQEGTAVRGTFLPIEPRPAPVEPAAAAAGMLPPPDRCRDDPPDLRPLAEHLLRDVHLVESLAAAIAIWREGAAGVHVRHAARRGALARRVRDRRPPRPLARTAPARALDPGDPGDRDGRRRADRGTRRAPGRGSRARASRSISGHARSSRRGASSASRSLPSRRTCCSPARSAARTPPSASGSPSCRAASAPSASRSELGLDQERARRNDLTAARARHEEELATLEADLSARLREERSLMERLAALQVELAAGRERTAHLEHASGAPRRRLRARHQPPRGARRRDGKRARRSG